MKRRPAAVVTVLNRPTPAALGKVIAACIHESQKGVAAIPPAAHPVQDTPPAVCILPSPAVEAVR